jgi:hypothetical protein
MVADGWPVEIHKRCQEFFPGSCLLVDDTIWSEIKRQQIFLKQFFAATFLETC